MKNTTKSATFLENTINFARRNDSAANSDSNGEAYGMVLKVKKETLTSRNSNFDSARLS